MEKIETTEYNLASYLASKNHRLESIEFKTKFAPQTGTFIFTRDDKIEKDIEDFFANCKVPIQDFINSSRALKHRLNFEMNKAGVYKYGLKKTIDEVTKRDER